jgi:endonuclease/exonuclease/phosphatase family metal-dependent hydrolase
MQYADYPVTAVQDIARLRRRITASGIPGKISDQNLIIGTWNIRSFGTIYPEWQENPGSPKRNWRALASIAEIASHFDVLAIQEVKRDLSGLRALQDWLGEAWGVITTDVTAGEAGNAERLAFIFDRRRVQPSGLAGELVLPPPPSSQPLSAVGITALQQFARTPYAVGFSAGDENFVLITAHIRYGSSPSDRQDEIKELAEYIAHEMRDRARIARTDETNLIVLGDFNIDQRGDDPLFEAFVSTGLMVPRQIESLPTGIGSAPKFYDQVAWFMGAFDLPYTGRAGMIDFAGAVFPELTRSQMSFRLSDHLPIWVEFSRNRSEQIMAVILGIDPAMPDPLASVPDDA